MDGCDNIGLKYIRDIRIVNREEISRPVGGFWRVIELLLVCHIGIGCHWEDRFLLSR